MRRAKDGSSWSTFAAVRCSAATVESFACDRERRMAEAPRSRTEPPRINGEQPILKTGRATGPRSLPRLEFYEIGEGRRLQIDCRFRLESEICNLKSAISIGELAFDQTDITRARAFLGFFGRELHTLAFAKQFEHRAAHRAAMKEVLNSAFVADEPKSLVNEEPCDCPGRHNPKPSVRTPRGIPRGLRPVTGACQNSEPRREAGRVFPSISSAGKSGPV